MIIKKVRLNYYSDDTERGVFITIFIQKTQATKNIKSTAEMPCYTKAMGATKVKVLLPKIKKTSATDILSRKIAI